MNNKQVLLLLHKYYLKIDKGNNLNTVISKFTNEYNNLEGGSTRRIETPEERLNRVLLEIEGNIELEKRKENLLAEFDSMLSEKNGLIIGLGQDGNDNVSGIIEDINKYIKDSDTKKKIIEELISAIDSNNLENFFHEYSHISQESLMLFAQNHIYKYLDSKNVSRSTIKAECFDLVTCGENSELGKLHIESSYQHGISFTLDKFIRELEIIGKNTNDDKSEKRVARLELFTRINQLDQSDGTLHFGRFFTWICNIMNGGDGFNQYKGQPLIITVSGGNIYIIFAKLLLNLKKGAKNYLTKLHTYNPLDDLITIDEGVLSSFTQLYFDIMENDDIRRKIIYEMIKKLSDLRLNQLIERISSSEYSDFDYKLLPNIFDQFRDFSEEPIPEYPTIEMTDLDKTELIGLTLDSEYDEDAEPGTEESSNLNAELDIGEVYLEVPYEDRDIRLYPGTEGTTKVELHFFNEFLKIKKEIEKLEKNVKKAGAVGDMSRLEKTKKKKEAEHILHKAKDELDNLFKKGKMHADAIKLYNQKLLASTGLTIQNYENFEEYDSTDGFLLSRCKFVLQYVGSFNMEFDSNNEEIKNLFNNILEQIKQIAQIEHVYRCFYNPCTESDISKLGISKENMYAQMAQENWLMIKGLNKYCEMYIKKLISTKRLIAYSTSLCTKIIVEIFQKQKNGTGVLFQANFDDFERKIFSYENYGLNNLDGILLYLHYISNRQNKYIKSYPKQKFDLSWNLIYPTLEHLKNQFLSLDNVLKTRTSNYPTILPLLLKDLVLNFTSNPEFKTKDILDYIVEYINKKDTYVDKGTSRYELVRSSHEYSHLKSLLSDKIQSIPGLMIFVNAIKFK